MSWMPQHLTECNTIATARNTIGTVFETVGTAATLITGSLNVASVGVGMANAYIPSSISASVVMLFADETFMKALASEPERG